MTARDRWAVAAPDLRLTSVSWWESKGVGEISGEMFGDRLGGHATPAEVAVAQFVHPGHIKQAQLEPLLASDSEVGFYDARDYRRRFPDGRIASDPSMASPEKGKKILDAAITDLTAKYNGFLDAA